MSEEVVLHTRNKKRDVPHLAWVRPPIPGAKPSWFCIVGGRAFPGITKEEAFVKATEFKEDI